LLTNKPSEEIEQHFSGQGYAKLKSELADVTIEFLKPIQERVKAIDGDKLNAILERGAAHAQGIAQATLSDAKRKWVSGRAEMTDESQTSKNRARLRRRRRRQ
jgi:tryptophanyl-tRNA synthetase